VANWKEWLAVGGKILGDVARATLIDFNRETQHLWLSQFALQAALKRHNSKPGLFGLNVDATVVPGPQLRLDVRTKPLGPAGYLVTDAASLLLTPSRYAVACRTTSRSSSAGVALKAMPIVFNAMLGLGLEAPDLRVHEDAVMYGNTLPEQSWFIALLRSLGGLRREAQVAVGVVETGLVLDLSQVLAPGVLIDVGTVAAHLLPPGGSTT
jgi:hypothetical protein